MLRCFLALVVIFFLAVSAFADRTTGTTTTPGTTTPGGSPGGSRRVRVPDLDQNWINRFRTIALTTPSQVYPSIPIVPNPRDREQTTTPFVRPLPFEQETGMRSCIFESTQTGCLVDLVLRAYEAYNTDPEHLFISLFQDIVEPDVVAFSSNMGPRYLRGSSEVLEMLVEGRQLGRSMIAMNSVFQHQLKVVTHFTMHVDAHHPKRDVAESKIEGLAVYYFNTDARIYQVHYALDSDSTKYVTGRTHQRNKVVRDVISQPGFDQVVRGDDSPSRPKPHYMLTFPERIRTYFDAWNTMPNSDMKFLEEEFERLISKDIEVRDLTWGSGKALRNYKLIKKYFLEDWRQEGKNLLSIEDAIWMPASSRVAVRMTMIGKVNRHHPEETTGDRHKIPAPLRIIAIFQFNQEGRVERIVKGYDSNVLETGEPARVPERPTPRQNWREEL